VNSVTTASQQTIVSTLVSQNGLLTLIQNSQSNVHIVALRTIDIAVSGNAEILQQFARAHALSQSIGHSVHH
jgi:hypothetical protein